MPAYYEVQIKNEAPKYRVGKARVLKAASGILKSLGWKKAGLSLWLVTDKKIRTLNRKHLGHDYATDVISFSQIEGEKIQMPGTIPFLGDIVISLDTTARQAEEFGNGFFYELAFYICHGVLHLMGYSDATPAKARAMEKKQTAVLKKLKIGNRAA